MSLASRSLACSARGGRVASQKQADSIGGKGAGRAG
jgi:hypothetical protein